MTEDIQEPKTLEEFPHMGYYIDPEAPVMFGELHAIINKDEGSLLIAFEMGSLILDISNPKNWLEVNRTYLKVENDDNNEISLLRIDKVTGIIYEPPAIKEPTLEDFEDCDCCCSVESEEQ